MRPRRPGQKPDRVTGRLDMRCLRWWLLVVVGMLVVVPEAARSSPR